jgi:hypothetical protein
MSKQTIFKSTLNTLILKTSLTFLIPEDTDYLQEVGSVCMSAEGQD